MCGMRLFLIINVTEAGSSESVLKKLIIEYSWRKRCRCLGNIESDIRIKTFFRICLDDSRRCTLDIRFRYEN